VEAEVKILAQHQVHQHQVLVVQALVEEEQTHNLNMEVLLTAAAVAVAAVMAAVAAVAS
jgi:hypothetical protein